jgi:hypothetical protein
LHISASSSTANLEQVVDLHAIFENKTPAKRVNTEQLK